MLKARNYKSNISRCPLMNCSYRNFRLDNLKNHLKSRRHKISDVNVLNKIFEMVQSNSLPEGTLLRYQNNNLVQIVIGLQANLDQAAAAAATPSSTSGSTLLQNSAEERDSQDTTVATDDEQLPDQYHQ